MPSHYSIKQTGQLIFVMYVIKYSQFSSQDMFLNLIFKNIYLGVRTLLISVNN